MRIDRRMMMGSLALLGGLPAAARALDSLSGGADTKPLPQLGEKPHILGPLVDRERAAEIMKREGLSGLIVSDPINLYYLTGLDLTQFMRSLVLGAIVYGVVPRNPAHPIGIVINSFGYYYSYANVQPERGVAIFQFSPGRSADEHDASNTVGLVATGRAALDPGEAVILPDRHQAPLDRMERERAARVRTQAHAHGVETSMTDALRRACRELELGNGRIGVDAAAGSDEWAAVAAAAAPGSLVPGAQTISRIRLVKSPAEIAMMRYAARANAAAAHAACAAVRSGATSSELRAMFYAEAAQRGGVGTWIRVDGLVVDSHVDRIHDGQAFMIDAVSTYDGYHGDYGRTVFVGEPLKTMRRHTSAIEHAWREVREQLRPGLRFSDIQRIGQQALDKGGFDTAVRITPHSIGILHTDALGIGDIVLEPGMIISVDFPVLETGIGGSAHLEDLTLITHDGCEILNDVGDPTITV